MKRQRDTTAHKLAVLNYHKEQLIIKTYIEMKKLFKLVYALLNMAFMLILTGIAVILTPVRIVWELTDDFSGAYYRHIDNFLDSKPKGEKDPGEEVSK